MDTVRRLPRGRASWLMTPVTAWASAGALFLLVGGCVIGRWTASGGFSLGTRGLDSLSTGRQITLWASQGTVAILTVTLILWAVRQWRREKQLTFDVALYLGYLSQFWMDPLQNLRHVRVMFNAAALHTPTWGPYIPGWSSPGQEGQIQGIFSGWFGYSMGAAWLFVFSTIIRRTLLAYRPQLSGIRFVLAILSIATVLDLLMESFWIHAGGYLYAEGWPPLTLFSGRWYQLPLYRTVLVAVFWVSIPYLARHYYLRNGSGMVVLRGIQGIPARWRSTVQALAVIGLLDCCILSIHLLVSLTSLIGGQIPLSNPPYPYV